MSEQNKAVVRRIIEEHWNRKNPSLVAELFSTNCALSTPDGPLQGQEGASLLYNAYATAFPDFRVGVDDTIADGNKVVVRYTFTGTQKGPLAAVPASGRQVSVKGIVIFRLMGAMVDDVHFVWDKFALLQQIGALPASGPAAAQVAS
jgi:steroid delta-isomerase-like uncharacterized protein